MSSGTWAALANPGALVTAAAAVSGDLVVGVRGGAAQYAGAADHAALAPNANVLDAQYCANRVRVMDGALMKLACEIWALEDAILLGKADLPKV
mgnify:CR=1 FL=1